MSAERKWTKVGVGNVVTVPAHWPIGAKVTVVLEKPDTPAEIISEWFGYHYGKACATATMDDLHDRLAKAGYASLLTAAPDNPALHLVGLVPGPNGTWFGPMEAMPAGWQARITMKGDDNWITIADPSDNRAVVQCRPPVDHESWCNKNQGPNSYAVECDCGFDER